MCIFIRARDVIQENLRLLFISCLHEECPVSRRKALVTLPATLQSVFWL
jgi:hypothetical protein